jgi:hypothetical protein
LPDVQFRVSEPPEIVPLKFVGVDGGAVSVSSANSVRWRVSTWTPSLAT